MTEIKFSLEEASSLTGIKVDELERQFKNAEGEVKDPAEISKIVSAAIIDKIKNHGEDQRKRGIREKGQEIEGVIRKFGISEFSDAQDAITKLVEDVKKKAKPSKEGDDELTKEQIMSSPIYKELLEGEISTIKTALGEKEQELSSLHKEVSLSEVKRIAHDKAMKVLNDNNANFGEGNKLQQARFDQFFRALGYDNLKVVNGTVVVTDDNGDPLLDQMKNQVSFDDYVKNNWLFGWNKGGGGSPPPPGGGPGGSPGLVITSSEQFQEALKGAKTAKERAEVYSAYSKFMEKE